MVGGEGGGDFVDGPLKVPLLHATNVTSRLVCQRQVMLMLLYSEVWRQHVFSCM